MGGFEQILCRRGIEARRISTRLVFPQQLSNAQKNLFHGPCWLEAQLTKIGIFAFGGDWRKTQLKSPDKMSKLKYLYLPFPGHPVLYQNTDPAKKRLVEELVKKYRGEEGERLAVLPLLEWLGNEEETNRDATVILAQKSMLTLVHQQMELELSGDLLLPEPVDKKIAVIKKLQSLWDFCLISKPSSLMLKTLWLST